MSSSSKNVTVDVSGSRFCIVPSLFKHIENLPWKKHKSNNRTKETLKLNANPDVFEAVLQFFLHTKLPDPKSLSPRRAKALIDFVSPLDQVAVKPLLKYLQPFVFEKSYTLKDSFMKRSLTKLSAPFSSRGLGRKSKSSNIDSTHHTVNQSASHTSITNKKKNYSNNLRNDVCLEEKNRSSIVSKLATHIENSTMSSTMIAEISVCSMDESSSVSKLSLQSSSASWGVPLPQVPQNDISVSIPKSMSPENHTHHLRDHYQPPNLGLSKEIAIKTLDQRNQKTNSILDDNAHSKEIQILTNESKVHCSKRNIYHGRENSSTRHKIPASKKIFRTILNENKLEATAAKSIGKDGKPYLFRKQEHMTHADWCASEYVC